MVERLRAGGIADLAVLHAFDAVPRHEFVPEAMRHRAYEDVPLPIGSGQTISSPTIHAISLELAEVDEGDRVLEVGTGSGFQTALLAELGAEVFSIERLPELSARAGEILSRLGYAARLGVGDGGQGLPDHAPFAAIIVGAAAAEAPGALFAQLSEGGRLIVPIGVREQVLYRYVRRGAEFVRERISGARFVPLIEQPLG
ncbi:MAG: protein-L-isoaspartate(D-aspartate) O-methyltransferase [Gemmatimonadetes bacterium]|nr:protein-L-isoaspartate(D-aspartate) O-methyltransferase [Gemmatimonadota bacterium]